MMTAWLRKIGPARLLAALFGLVIAGLVVYLAAAEKPWQIKLPRAAKWRPEHFAAVYSWWAALINVFPLAVLALTTRWWARRTDLPAPGPERRSLPVAFWTVVAAAMIFCAAANFPRLPYSFWDDEEYSVRRAVVGTYRPTEDGGVKLRKLPWSTTLWYYAKPTNHILQSVLSRLSNSAWRAMARPKGLQFWEPAVRFPSYLAGICAIGATAFVLAKMGYVWAGACAAALLALHPWYMRFVPEARGYALVFLLMALNWLCVLGITRGGRWRWWLGFAATEFCLIYTWPGSLPLVAFTNLCVVVAVLSLPALRPAIGILLWRWAALSVVVGVLLFQLLLPCAPQFLTYLKDCVRLPMEWYWLRNVGALLVTGSAWSRTGRLDSPYPEYLPFAHAHPWVAILLLVLTLAFLAAGLVRLGRDPVPGNRIFAALWILPGPLTFFIAKAKGEYLFEWYMAFAVPGLVCLAALGMTAGLSFFPERRAWRIGAAAALAFLLGGYGVITHGPRHFLMSRPVQYIKESVLLTRPTLDPHAQDNRMIVTVATIASPEVYDPHVRRAPSVETLAECLAEADAKNVPLYVNQGFPAALKAEFPATHAMVTDPALFEKVAELPAIEEMLDRVVYRYRPGSIAGKDLSVYGENPPLNRAFIY